MPARKNNNDNNHTTVRIGVKDVWLRMELFEQHQTEIIRKLDIFTATGVGQDHEGRLRNIERSVSGAGWIEDRLKRLERWMYALPPTLALGIASLLVQLLKK